MASSTSKLGLLARARRGARCLLAVLAAVSPAAAGVEIHVSPKSGEDSLDRDGSASHPYRTLTYAIARAEGLGGGARLDVILAPGAYAEEDPARPELGGEVFPIRLPASYAEISLRGGGSSAPAGGEAAVLASAAGEAAILEARSGASDSLRDLEVADLELRGGAAGLTLEAEAGGFVRARAERCRFSSQVRAAVEVRAAGRGEASFALERSNVRSAGGGLVAETGPEAVVGVCVAGCRIEDLRAYGPGGILGSAVDVHLDARARASVRVERNAFLGVASGVVLTSSEPEPGAPASAGSLYAQVVGNLIAGRRPGGGGSDAGALLRAGAYFSLWPHHEIDILIASNTFAEVAGPVVYQDNLDALGLAEVAPPEGGVPAAIPFTFVNNICYHVLAPSEFEVEGRGAPFPPEGVAIFRNVLERSSLGAELADGNLSLDPLFADPDAGDFRLRPESPAVDRADPEYADLTLWDLDGRCRRASAACRLGASAYPMDLGAYELPGFCDRDVRVFRRGDCDGDAEARVEISDAIFTFAHLFLGGKAPQCPDACDSNDDGGIDLTDGVYTLGYLFLGGPPPLPPFDRPGTDPTRDCLEPSG
ncbi:MAG: DUF1565 domain-containing protein [Planctomycetota bacterium]